MQPEKKHGMIYTQGILQATEPDKSRKTSVAHELLKALLYFDIFHYPLTAKELKRFCRVLTTFEEVDYELTLLEKSGYVKQTRGYFAISTNDIEQLVKRREEGSIKAEALLKNAKYYSSLISYFPFVRGIYLSGSLSKGYADDKSDVDYFIITEPGRLWICRMMLVLFKRLFLFNSHKYFCVNYFVDSNSLEIHDINIFTATELATLVPVCNLSLYHKLMQANPWVKEYFPNTLLQTVSADNIPNNNSWIKKGIEKLFIGKIGDKLDDIYLRITVGKWKKKFKNLSEPEFELNLRSRKNTSKHHPQGFQLKVEAAFRQKISEFEQKFEITLD